MATGTVADWGSLPMEILDEMVNRLPGDITDLIRFGCVCHSWRSSSLETNKKSWGPWMMLSEPEPSHNFLEEGTLLLLNTFNEEEEGGDYKVYADYDQDVPRRFLDLSTNKIIQLYLPETRGRRCLGSSFGWIFTLGLDLNIHLLNPLTRIQISLPPQPTFPEDEFEDEYEYEGEEVDYYYDPRNLRRVFVSKFALSSHPTNNNKVVVMVIYSGLRKLAFASPGDKAWTTLKSPWGAYDDVTFFKDHFYAIQSGTGVVRVCNISSTGSVPEAIDFIMSPPPLDPSCRYYLVEIFGDLHVVARFYFGDDTKMDLVHMTSDFKIFKLDFFRKEWIELHDLGNHALFIGNNTAFAISTSNRHLEFQSNFIYFTDDFYEFYNCGISDTGLFDFHVKKIMKPFYRGDGIYTTFCAPMFFIPNLH